MLGQAALVCSWYAGYLLRTKTSIVPGTRGLVGSRSLVPNGFSREPSKLGFVCIFLILEKESVRGRNTRQNVGTTICRLFVTLFLSFRLAEKNRAIQFLTRIAFL